MSELQVDDPSASSEGGMINWNRQNGDIVPQAPDDFDQTGISVQQLQDLALKFGATASQFTTEWISRNMCLPAALVEELCWQLRDDHYLEVVGQAGPLNYQYSLTQSGREQAKLLRTISGYVGPAPISLYVYREHLLWQTQQYPDVKITDVERALSAMVLNRDAIEVAALAAASRRSLFMFGPPGNGKTTIGRLLHNVNSDTIWIPHAIQIDSSLIRLFDPQIHERVPVDDPERELDHRWVKIKRPFVLVGGELAISDLDLKWSESLHFYEAPPHMKANGGTFVIDDFGRQRMEPSDLLNRWIVPLETRHDYLTLHTGQRIEVPFEMMLTVATNLKVEDVADPAFLRRMGYRFHVQPPSKEQYSQIFKNFANRVGMEVEATIIPHVLQRYDQEQREIRASEAGELIQRCQDICKLHSFPNVINLEVIDIAWSAFFGNQ